MPDSRNPVDISRRSLLRNASVVLGGGAVLVTALAAERAKAANQISQEAAAYQPIPKNGAQCDICVLFQPPISCSLVEGNISVRGWCKYFTPRV